MKKLIVSTDLQHNLIRLSGAPIIRRDLNILSFIQSHYFIWQLSFLSSSRFFADSVGWRLNELP